MITLKLVILCTNCCLLRSFEKMAWHRIHKHIFAMHSLTAKTDCFTIWDRQTSFMSILQYDNNEKLGLKYPFEVTLSFDNLIYRELTVGSSRTIRGRVKTFRVKIYLDKQCQKAGSFCKWHSFSSIQITVKLFGTNCWIKLIEDLKLNHTSMPLPSDKNSSKVKHWKQLNVITLWTTVFY